MVTYRVNQELYAWVFGAVWAQLVGGGWCAVVGALIVGSVL